METIVDDKKMKKIIKKLSELQIKMIENKTPYASQYAQSIIEAFKNNNYDELVLIANKMTEILKPKKKK